jgi:hypothetical protein
VLAAFTAIGALYVRPLFDHLDTRLASDPYDPALNATVLWWNATVVPFTERWWNQPFFHPTTGVTAFTENLTGLAPLSALAYWIAGSPVAAYNITFFATWPLSAFAAYLLVARITRRVDAGIVAGLVFGFSPYRAAELAHLQSLAAFYLPVGLAALHAYLDDRRRRWLVLFGVMWVLQSLSNGYYMLFGAVLIALWLAWFCSTRRSWRAGLMIGAAWAVSSLPLVPALLKYRQIHEHYGLHRQYFELLAFSAHPQSWFEVSGFTWLWSRALHAGSDDLFPGLTAVLLVAAAAIAGMFGGGPVGTPETGRDVEAKRGVSRYITGALAAITLASLAALVVMLAVGPWSIERSSRVLFRMTDPYRALSLLAVCGIPLLWMRRATRAAIVERRPFVFYAAATIVMALLACGPVLSVHDTTILDSAPYRWLLALPGFDQLRVPARFWMMGLLSLAAAAGLGYASLTRSGARRRPRMHAALFVVIVAAMLAEGWLTTMPTGEAPATWTVMQGADPALPLLELPIGPDWDGAATFRTTAHHRRVVNGVSGYDPPSYAPLQEGLRARDPQMLAALASLGTYEVAIERVSDPDETWARYVSSAPGARLAAADGDRTIYRVPAAPFVETAVGPPLAIASVRSSRGDPAPVIDGRIDTDWVDHPQHPDQWLLVELGRPETVGGISLAIEEHSTDFPRHLVIELSGDGQGFVRVWDGNAAPLVFLAAVREPRRGWLRVGFPQQRARYVRIRQTAHATIGWRVPELEINAPAPR